MSECLLWGGPERETVSMFAVSRPTIKITKVPEKSSEREVIVAIERSVITSSLVAGTTLFLVGAAFHFLVGVAAPSIPPQFLNTALFRPWDGWTSRYMAVHPFAYGFVFSVVYLSLLRWSKFPPGIRGGLIYGIGVFVAGSLPVFLLVFASIAISPEVSLSWVLQSMVQYMFAGMILGIWCNRRKSQPTDSPYLRSSVGFVPPPNVEWVEHPVVVLNSRVLLYQHAIFGVGKASQADVNPDPEYLYSDYYLIVEDSEEDFSRHWVSSMSWLIVDRMMGQQVGSEFTWESMKGPRQYKVLAVHIPSDGRTFRLTELAECQEDAHQS